MREPCSRRRRRQSEGADRQTDRPTGRPVHLAGGSPPLDADLSSAPLDGRAASDTGEGSSRPSAEILEPPSMPSARSNTYTFGMGGGRVRKAGGGAFCLGSAATAFTWPLLSAAKGRGAPRPSRPTHPTDTQDLLGSLSPSEPSSSGFQMPLVPAPATGPCSSCRRRDPTYTAGRAKGSGRSPRASARAGRGPTLAVLHADDRVVDPLVPRAKGAVGVAGHGGARRQADRPQERPVQVGAGCHVEGIQGAVDGAAGHPLLGRQVCDGQLRGPSWLELAGRSSLRFDLIGAWVGGVGEPDKRRGLNQRAGPFGASGRHPRPSKGAAL